EYLFSYKVNDETYAVLTAEEYSAEDREYIKTVYYGIAKNFYKLLDIVGDSTENFKLEKIFKADFAAILISAYEMLWVKDIPASVSINEAVELSKVYSTADGYKFVNGVLSGINKKLPNYNV
ncbi:MAG: hypothetical protein LBN25_04695, partial [Christensenellaceae bacterium]|nr:hypothetical protein [Christensenellaceae bacterium]